MKYEQKIISLSYNLNPIFSKRAHVRGHTHTYIYIYIYIWVRAMNEWSYFNTQLVYNPI